MAAIESDELKKAFAIQTGFQALSALASDLPAAAVDRLLAHKSMKPYAFLVELLSAAHPTAVEEAMTS